MNSENYSTTLSGTADPKHAIHISILMRLINKAMKKEKRKFKEWFAAPETLVKPATINNELINVVVPDIVIFNKKQYLTSNLIDMRFFIEVTTEDGLNNAELKAKQIFIDHHSVIEGFICIYNAKEPYFKRIHRNKDKSDVKIVKSLNSVFLDTDLTDIFKIFKSEFKIKK
jgi:hypothetical protein